MRHPRDVRRLVRRVLSGPPTLEVGRRSQDAGLDETVVRGAMELALRVGEAMLSLGAAAADVAAAILAITRAFGLLGCQVDVTFTAITLSYDRGRSVAPVTLMRVVTGRVDDYGRLSGVLRVAKEVAARPVRPVDALATLDAADARLDEVVSAPHPYPRWLVTVLLAVMAAAVAILLGGGFAVAAVAGLTTVGIDRAVWRLARWGLPPFFRQAAGAAIATAVAVGILVAAPHLPFELVHLPPSLVVASGIVVLLAGLSLVGSAEDAISGFPVTASGRAFEVVVLTLGIVAGIGGVLDMARRAGVPLEVIAVPTNSSPLVVQALAAALVAAAWGLASYARLRAAAASAAAGGVAWVIFTVATGWGLGAAVASAVAALVIGFLAESVGPHLRVPPLVISVCGIVPLLPGLAIYRALFQLVSEPASNGGMGPGATGLVAAATVGLGLAAGVTLGEFVAAAWRRGREARRDRALAPAGTGASARPHDVAAGDGQTLSASSATPEAPDVDALPAADASTP